MAEVTSVKHIPKYKNQPTPFLRNRDDKEEFREISRRNKQIHQKLKDIKSGPPSTFHAPKGYESVSAIYDPQRKKVPQRTAVHESNVEELLDFKENPVDTEPTQKSNTIKWPPDMPAPPHTGLNRTRELRAVDAENLRMQKAIGDIYRSRQRSVYAQNKEPSHRVDCDSMWTMRTSLYQPPQDHGPSDFRPIIRPSSARHQAQPSSTTIKLATSAVVNTMASTSNLQRRPQSAPRSAPSKGVPKSLGMAMCAGCGAKAFHKADGPSLTPCPGCEKVFYCSDTCQKMDFQSHKSLCKYHTNGVWQPYGRRPEDDYWVNNAAMARARHELKVRKSRMDNLGIEDELEEAARVEEVMKAARAKEKAAVDKQAKIEWRAYWGLDGPRPCLYMGGKRV